MTRRAKHDLCRESALEAAARGVVSSLSVASPSALRGFTLPSAQRGFTLPSAQRGFTLPSAQRGFTLIELMLVISIMALLLGIGLGVFSRLDLGDRATQSLVENAIRSAHNWSVARHAPARVTIDAKEGTLLTEGLAVIGTWHFEKQPIEGAFGLDGVMGGGRLVEDGFQGRALSFVGEPPHSRVEVPVQQDPSYDLRRGFALYCALRVEAGRGGALLKIGDSVGLNVTGESSVQGWFLSETRDDQGLPQRGGTVQIETPPLALPSARWAEVELRYDRRHLELFVDETLVARVAESSPVWKIEGPLVISPGIAPFQGAIDNLVISAVAGEEEIRLPKTVAFAKDVPRQILFAPGGELDRFAHREPLRVALEFEDGREVPILVNLYGTVE
jgi:prepilin-type N-terminal cleavage/methylation domain-containing protein